MACTIQFTKAYQDKYGLPETMPEAEFYAWLDNGGMGILVKEGKISIPGYVFEGGRFRENLTTIASKYAQKIVKGLNAIVAAAEKKGENTVKAKIDELQKAAKQFLKDNGIKDSKNILNAIAKLRNEVQFAKLLTLINEKGDLDARLYQVEQVDKKLDKIQKMRKSTKRLTATNRKYIRELELPSSDEVSDLEGYGKLLDAYIAARTGGAANTNVEADIDNFVEGEKAYIDAYKEQINNIKELVKKAKLAEEFRKLNAEGAFEGSDIKTEDDWINLKTRIEDETAEEAQQISDQNKLDAILEKAANKQKLIEGVIKNIQDFLKVNKDELESDFAYQSSKENPVSLSDIEAIDLTKLNYNELVLLNNILQNIAYSGDFTGVGQFTSIGRLSQNKQYLFDAWGKALNRTFNAIKDSAKRTMIQTITEITNGGEAANAAMEFVMGGWNGMIGRLRGQYNAIFTDYEKLKKGLAKTGKEIFKSTTRIDTYAFINQWFKEDSDESQIKHVKDRIDRRASQLATQYSNLTGNLSIDEQIKLEGVKEGLKALQDFGLIENLDFTDNNVKYDLVKDITLDSLSDLLNEKEQKLYDFMISTFEALLPNFREGVENNLGKTFDEIQNYFPTFTEQALNSLEDNLDSAGNLSLINLMGGFSPFSKTKSNTKDRSKTLASDKFQYKTGLTDVFSNGLWMTLMTAGGSNEMADMSNMLNTKWGLDRLNETGGKLSPGSIKIIRDQLMAKAKADMSYGHSSQEVEKAVKNELGKLANNAIVGVVLKDWTQVIKQGVIPLLTSFSFNRKLTYTVLRLSSNKEFKSAVDALVSQTSVQDRMISYLQSPTATGVAIEKLRGGKATAVKGIRATIAAQEYISDIITPIMNTFKDTKYKSLLEGVDASVSQINIVVGYVANRQKQNPSLTFQDIVKELNEGRFNRTSIQAAERYQADMNAPSNQNDAAKILKTNKGWWFMKGFPLATNQSFKQAASKLIHKSTSELTSDERKDLHNTVWRYVVQQTLYRTATSYLINKGVSAIIDLIRGDDDDDKYELEKTFLSGGAGLFSDLAFGSYSVGVDIAFALAANVSYKLWANGVIKEEKKENPDFNSKSLNTPLMPEPQVGGAVAVGVNIFTRAFETFNDEYELAKKEEKEHPVLEALEETILRELTPLFTGSGSVRYVLNKANAIHREENRKKQVIFDEAMGKRDSQYHLDDDKLNSILRDLGNAKIPEIRSRLVLKEEDGKATLYIIPLRNIEGYRRKAAYELYHASAKIGATPFEIYKSMIPFVVKKLETDTPGSTKELTDAQKIKIVKSQINSKVSSYVDRDLSNHKISLVKKYVLK